MKIRPLGNRLILKDYIPTQSTQGIILPEKLRQRFLYSNARWARVLAVGTKCPKGHVDTDDIVLAHYEEATAMPEAPGVWSVPFEAVLAKTEPQDQETKDRAWRKVWRGPITDSHP